MSKKLKLSDFDLGVTLGTGIISNFKLFQRFLWQSEASFTQDIWQVLGCKDSEKS